jgi:hypothetical protein
LTNVSAIFGIGQNPFDEFSQPTTPVQSVSRQLNFTPTSGNRNTLQVPISPVRQIAQELSATRSSTMNTPQSVRTTGSTGSPDSEGSVSTQVVGHATPVIQRTTTLSPPTAPTPPPVRRSANITSRMATLANLLPEAIQNLAGYRYQRIEMYYPDPRVKSNDVVYFDLAY